jgi:Zn-dependent protease
VNGHTLQLGSLFGIPLELDISWFLIFALLTWTMAVGFYPAEFKGWTTATYWFLGAATSITLFVCVLLHELAHALIAMRYKLPVERITLFIFGGVSHIDAGPPGPEAEFWISLAGPAVSGGVALLLAASEPLFRPSAPSQALVEYLASINVILAVFNLIPGSPLDGGRVLQAVIWRATGDFRHAARIARLAGQIIAFSLIIAGVWQIIDGNWPTGLWIAFVGWFLELAAASQREHMEHMDLPASRSVPKKSAHKLHDLKDRNA